MTSLSVVTPSLEQLDYLRHCVASVRAQDIPVEHHVADGGSRDGTVAWLRVEGLSYRSGQDQGMYDALNTGFRATRGDVLGWLNCDDLWFPWTARTVLEAFERRPELDILVGDAVEVRDGRPALVVHPPSALLELHFEGGGFLAQPAVFFRRRVFERMGGFDTSLKLLGDHDFFLRAWRAGMVFGRSVEFLAVQRMVEGQLMERHAQLARRERARILGTHVPRALRPVDAALGHALQAGWHRAAMAAWIVGGGWPRAHAAGLLRLPIGRALAALFASTAGRRYVEPGAGWSTVLPALSPDGAS